MAPHKHREMHRRYRIAMVDRVEQAARAQEQGDRAERQRGGGMGQPGVAFAGIAQAAQRARGDRQAFDRDRQLRRQREADHRAPRRASRAVRPLNAASASTICQPW
jgi:hypothetical protein